MLDQLKPQLDCPNCGEKNISGYPCRHCSYDPDMHLEPFWSPEIDQIYEDAYKDRRNIECPHCGVRFQSVWYSPHCPNCGENYEFPDPHNIKQELAQAYSNYRWLQREIATHMDEDWQDDDAIQRLHSDFMAAWGKYWDVCVKMSTDKYAKFKGRKRGLRYSLIKHRVESRRDLLKLDPAYLERERLPLPGSIKSR